jgi:dihydroflavonol-4-reductase
MADQSFGVSEEVFLTGATGFVGSYVLDALQARGYSVRALVRGDPSSLRHNGCTVVRGDLREPGALTAAMRGCRYLVHVGAMYTFAPREAAAIRLVNVQGTRGLLEAARIAGVERAVVTSSSTAVGPARNGRPADENAWADPHHRGVSAYHASKVLQERVALAARVPVVTVLPTAPVGAGDRRPTPTGKMIVDLMRGRIPATLGGGMNVVAVTDVAAAHVDALERGRPRQRYLLGGVNLTLAELFRLIARAAGRRAPSVRMPYALAAVAAAADELRCRITGAEPNIPRDGVRMGRLFMYASSEKAVNELGYRPSPIEPAIEQAVLWYRQHGYAA